MTRRAAPIVLLMGMLTTSCLFEFERGLGLEPGDVAGRAVARPADDRGAARETVAAVQDARAVVVALIVPLHSLGVRPRVGDGGANPFAT